MCTHTSLQSYFLSLFPATITIHWFMHSNLHFKFRNASLFLCWSTILVMYCISQDSIFETAVFLHFSFIILPIYFFRIGSFLPVTRTAHSQRDEFVQRRTYDYDFVIIHSIFRRISRATRMLGAKRWLNFQFSFIADLL